MSGTAYLIKTTPLAAEGVTPDRPYGMVCLSAKFAAKGRGKSKARVPRSRFNYRQKLF
jgi:hypothetical protein